MAPQVASVAGAVAFDLHEPVSANVARLVARKHFTARAEVGRWVGTLDDVALLMRQCRDLLRATSGGAGSGNVVVQQPGLTLEYEEPDEFGAETSERDRSRIRSISYRCSAARDEGRSTAIALEISPSGLGAPVSLTVDGPDRTIVEGLRTQIAETMDDGRRFPGVAGGSIGIGISAVGGLVALALIAAGRLNAWTPGYVERTGETWSALIVVGTCALLIAVLAVAWPILFPGFEWLASDRRTRWDRSRRWVIRVAGAIAVSVVAGVIVALATS